MPNRERDPSSIVQPRTGLEILADRDEQSAGWLRGQSCHFVVERVAALKRAGAPASLVMTANGLDDDGGISSAEAPRDTDARREIGDGVRLRRMGDGGLIEVVFQLERLV